MAAEREDQAVREVRLEGGKLVAVGAVLLILLGAAFYLGRWVERRASPPRPAAVGAAGAEDPLANVEAQPPIDVGAELDHFDRVEGPGKQLEPEREVRRAPAPVEPAATPAPAAPQPAASGPSAAAGQYFVQVWAGRDREAAELLVAKLQGEGYGVRLFSDRSGGDTLYKVRVGAYATEDRAREVSDELEQRGYRGAWVTSAD